MIPFLFNIAESLILVISLSTDAFAAGISYGADKIKIPFSSAAVISFVCSLMLALSMVAGGMFGSLFPKKLTGIICFIILLVMGLGRLFDSFIKSLIRKHSSFKLNFASHDLKFVLTVYADVKYADADNSKCLSAKEAAALSAALSLDSIAVGIGTAISGINIFLPIILSLIMTFAAVNIGCRIGEKLNGMLSFDLSYISGILLIILAFTRLI